MHNPCLPIFRCGMRVHYPSLSRPLPKDFDEDRGAEKVHDPKEVDGLLLDVVPRTCDEYWPKNIESHSSPSNSSCGLDDNTSMSPSALVLGLNR